MEPGFEAEFTLLIIKKSKQKHFARICIAQASNLQPVSAGNAKNYLPVFTVERQPVQPVGRHKLLAKRQRRLVAGHGIRPPSESRRVYLDRHQGRAEPV